MQTQDTVIRSVVFEESRKDPLFETEDIDLAAVLLYFKFLFVGHYKTERTVRGSRKKEIRTVFQFERIHPQEHHDIEEMGKLFYNGILKCDPKALFMEARVIRNLAHEKKTQLREGKG